MEIQAVLLDTSFVIRVIKTIRNASVKASVTNSWDVSRFALIAL